MDGNFTIEGLASQNEAKKNIASVRTKASGDEAAVDGL